MVTRSVLQAKRKSLGLTVYMLSKRAKVSRKTIDRYEANDLPSEETDALKKLLVVLYPDSEERLVARQEVKRELRETRREIKDKKRERKMLTRIRKSYRAAVTLKSYPVSPIDSDPSAGMQYKKPRCIIYVFEGKGKTGKPILEFHSDKGIAFVYGQQKAIVNDEALKLLIDFCDKRGLKAADLLKFMSATLIADERFHPDMYQHGENLHVAKSQLELIRLATEEAGVYLTHKQIIEANDQEVGNSLLKAGKFIARLLDQPKDVVQLKADMLALIEKLIEKTYSLQ